jgi:predicted permease
VTVFEVRHICSLDPHRSIDHLQSVVEVFILCFAGYVLSRSGVTDKATQRKLNVINVSLFTPALLFSKVRSISVDDDQY